MAKRIKPSEEEEMGTELNLVPYMDIMINLIMFMLFTTTSLTQMGVINVSAPQYGPPSETSISQDEKKDEPQVDLSLLLSEEGFTVMANGVEVDGHPGEVTIKRLGEGRWDFEGLTKKMIQLKDTYPSQSTLVVVASPTVAYEVLVKTMDATREVMEPTHRILFPDVVLGVF